MAAHSTVSWSICKNIASVAFIKAVKESVQMEILKTEGCENIKPNLC